MDSADVAARVFSWSGTQLCLVAALFEELVFFFVDRRALIWQA